MSDLERVKKLRAAAIAAVTRFEAEGLTRVVRTSDGDGKKPGYNGATWLYVRAFDGDAGARPVPSGQVFWDSPDVELFDAASVRIANNELSAGNAYTAEVTVTNDGDLDCNTCLVELFLDDPSIGFGVAAATALGVQFVAVPQFAKAVARFPFTATAAMVGHRCIFARVSSFSTNDLPADWVGFDARNDRHLGQQNLNVMAQGTTFTFNVHLRAALLGKPLALELLSNPAALLAAPPRIAGPLVAAHERVNDLAGIAVTRRPLPDRVEARGQLPEPGPALHVPSPAHEALPLERAGRFGFRTDRPREALAMNVPRLGLRPNEALPLELRLIDPATGEVVGGITLLVVG